MPVQRAEELSLVSVMVGLVWTVLRETEVVGLLCGQLGQLDVQSSEVRPGHLLVQLLGQHEHSHLVIGGLAPQLDLGQHLVGEGAGHDEARVTHGTTEIDETTLGQEDDVLAVGESEPVHLGLDVGLQLGVLLQPLDLDLTVEVTDVADDGVVLHHHEVLAGDDVLTASGGHEDVTLGDSLVHGGDLETLASGLESVDGVDLRHDDTAAEALEGGGTALADISVPGHQSDLTRREELESLKYSIGTNLAAQHDVSGSLNSVNQGLSATVQVVELGLGHGVVHVDGGDLQGAVLEHLVQVVDSGSGLLRQTPDVLKVLGVLLVDEVGEVTTVVEDHVEGLAVREDEGLLNAPDVLLVCLSLPGVDWDTAGGHGSCGVILNDEK